MKLSVILLLCALSTLSMAADKVYKWVDKDGNIHYSENRPENQPATKLKMPKAAAPTVQAPKNDEPSDAKNEGANANETAAETAEDAQAKADAKKQLAESDRINGQKLCQQAKNNRSALNASVRVAHIDPKTGKQVRMSDDERVNALQKAEQAIKDYCQ